MKIRKALVRLIVFCINGLYKKLSVANKKFELRKIVSEFKSIGFNPQFSTPYMIKNPQYISIGDNFLALHNLRLEAWDSYYNQKFNPKMVIGNNVVFQSDCHIGCVESVIIEDNVLLASRVFITDHYHGNINYDDLDTPPRLRNLSTKGPVIIKENVWIGEGVSIMPNITIGKGSIIGANSVVTKDIPPYSIAAGVPARVIKTINQNLKL